MIVRKSNLFLAGISFLSIVLALFLYPFMPEQMASHWDISGNVDGYTSAFWGLAIFPILIIIFSILFSILPNIDPEKKNIEKFRSAYDRFVLSFIFFFLSIFLFVVLWNLGIKIPINILFSFGFAFLFYSISQLIAVAQKNWFIGIRTPWTLNSEVVWEKTHKLGAKLFRYCSAISLVGLFSSNLLIYSLLPVVFVSVYLTVYSYREYNRVVKLKK